MSHGIDELETSRNSTCKSVDTILEIIHQLLCNNNTVDEASRVQLKGVTDEQTYSVDANYIDVSIVVIMT